MAAGSSVGFPGEAGVSRGLLGGVGRQRHQPSIRQSKSLALSVSVSASIPLARSFGVFGVFALGPIIMPPSQAPACGVSELQLLLLLPQLQHVATLCLCARLPALII